ncbi:TonB-dependent receptor [Noviherbaspirillum sp. DKR-6]|uniref:TonB-dependent receptor n=1 Tax=Noviherbaspirillum pedocola TaxID=2801341 RepID=A0A934W8F3_9BURK|nr:TonB-dependent receptor [Noviherbaspirillum pedocola]
MPACQDEHRIVRPAVPPRAAPAQRLAPLGLLLAAFCAHAHGAELADLSLEELANIEVTSVSKRAQPLSDAPASIYVITNNDIRRSGATSLPEALRLAPNLQIAQVDARNYAITARGFNSPFENKLLVLIDGRTVYTPLFSGVFWDVQSVMLEDVERIEVVSGPGATLWGANAVNGVINIITRSAADTQGALASVGGSKFSRSGAARYGGELSNGGHYRVYGKADSNEDLRNEAGGQSLTGWHRKQAGFRADWGNPGSGYTIQGDAYDGALHQARTADIQVSGANLIGRINRILDGGSKLNLQAYWDHTERNQPLAFAERLDTFDLQAQHALQLGSAQQLVWGGGYRLARDRVDNGVAFGFLPGDLNMNWANIFAQDEIALSDKLKLTGGLKLERNNYTGVETLPTLRLAYKPNPTSLAWSALSRSVRAPSRIDRDLFSPTNPKTVNGVPQYAIAGGPNFASEVADVLEVGYRAQPLATLSYSVTAFYSQYRRLRTTEPNPVGAGLVFENRARGRNSGVEMWGNWQALPRWRLSAGLVVQRVETELDADSRDQTGTTGLATSDPSNFWQLRSSIDIAEGKELDVMMRHVGALSSPALPAYTAIDMRYGWKLRRDLELSLLGQNLFDAKHAEFGAAPGRALYERALYVKLVWRQ